MSELSSEARALVSDGRGVLRPSREDRARIASRLARHLGAAALLSAPSSFAAEGATVASRLSSVVAALGLLAAGATYTFTRPAEVPVAATPPARAAVLAEAGPASAPCVAVAPSSTAEPELSVSPPLAAARKAPGGDRLGAEVDLLSRATSLLRAGNAAEALEVLEQHRRRFPAGGLVEERRAARAQALCALGDRSGAQAELTQLAHAAPRSPHVARAQRACGP